MPLTSVTIATKGESLYDITEDIRSTARQLYPTDNNSGILHLFVMHTSCALLISEAYDPSAQRDIERFLDHLAPRSLPFIEHTLEGPDDSPSHMKSAILHQHLAIPVESNDLVLGTWQGIYLAEFRDHPHRRQVALKFQPDKTL